MELKHKLEQIFNNDYPGTERFIADVIEPIFGNEIEYINDDLAEREKYAEKAKNASIKHIRYIGDLTEKNYNAENIALLDVTLDDSKNIERSRVNIQQLIRSIVNYRQHLMIVFHYEDVTNKQWRFSYAYKGDSLKDSTSAKRYTYVFGRGYRGRTAAERFEILAKSQRNDEDFEKAFSVAALSDEFFNKYRDIYADFVQYITGKRYEKIKNKWEEVKKKDPNTEIFSQFKNEDKKVRDYIKKMLGRLTFLCFLQRKGWMNNDKNFLQNLYQTFHLQTDFLDAVLEPLFFGVLNTSPEKRKEVFAKNGWNIELADKWKEIPYLNGGLFEQTKEDKLSVKFPKELFYELFKFLGEYNFTIDENDPDDAEIGIDPEMLGRVFESLLEDNKDKGAFYTPKEIVQYMCRQSIIEYLKTYTDQSLHTDIEDLINRGLVNHTLQNKDNARNLYKLLKEVTVCDPAIGSGAFPMGILNILFTARQHLYGFLKESEPFNPLDVKKAIIRDNIYGVDIEQGAVDIARLRFWLAILVEEQVATPLPNLDYRIVRGNSLITTFNDEYIQLPETPDGRTKLAKLKKELHQLQNDLFDLNGDNKFQREIEIKCKTLEIIKVQLGIDKASAQKDSKIESDIFEDKKLSGKALKKAKQARAIEEVKSNSLFALNNLITSLTTTATPLADRAQIDIKFFDWKIVFNNIFNEDNGICGFDIIIGNPPYIDSETMTSVMPKHRKLYKTLFSTAQGNWDMFIVFIELGISILKKKGVFSYIIPNKLIAAKYAITCREYIQKLNLKVLRDYGDVAVFDADVYPCVILIKNEESNGYKVFQKMGDLIASTSSNEISSEFFQGDLFWDKYFIDPLTLATIIKISNNPTLGSLGVDIKGAATVAEAYLIKEILVDEPNSKKNAYKLINTGSIDKYHHLWGNKRTQYIKGIYQYPVVYASALAKINQTRLSQAMSKKIVIASMSNTIEAVYDNGNALAGKSTSIILGDEYILKSILPIINSKLIEFWLLINYNSLKMAGGYINVGVNEINSLPIHDFKAYQSILCNISERLEKNPNDEYLLNNADVLVYHLYDLTYDEVLIIDPQTPISRDEYESFNLDTYGQS